MHCPFCQHVDTRVIDSRVSDDGATIRRRRECEACGERFSTLETIELKLPVIIKGDGRREQFDARKLRMGFDRAHRRLDLLLRHRTLLQCAIETDAQLARVERLAPAVVLDDHRQLELDRLQRREALAAGLALAPAADRHAVVADARIDDAGVDVLAEGAVQGRLSVNRELPALPGDVVAHAGNHVVVAGRIEHVADPVGERDAVGFLVTTRRHCRRTQAQP